MLNSMNILVIVGGTNESSNAEYLADRFIDGLRESGVGVEKIRLREIPLEHFHLDHYHGREAGRDFPRIQQLMQNANGLVISSPVWNFSVPAHLKNFIDHVGSFALDHYTRTKGQLNGLPCYFLFTGGAPTVAWRGLMRFTTMHLPESLRYFGASIAGVHYEGKCMLGPGKFGLVLDQRPSVQDDMRLRGKAFAELVKRFSQTGILPLRLRIKATLYRWGQRLISKF